ncbi:hypothetical protein [Streptococcus pseudopneumoniae]|uniref:hypothetical protein n=1 Tax=Streptococcus pseudopneumoniae TaxID=257758 RepID=UPI0029E829CB|nr:hypothetical protein [Streptococcus pseudopneumoniae]
MPSYIELDKEYLELKYFLMRTPTYEDETIAQKKESVFAKIFEEYYDRLPEEERFIIPNYFDMRFISSLGGKFPSIAVFVA